VEKQIVTVSYWLGSLSSVIALALRELNILGTVFRTVVQQGRTCWYMSSFRGAILFFLIAIATASNASMRGEKTS
jgi:hypothetical protein